MDIIKIKRKIKEKENFSSGEAGGFGFGKNVNHSHKVNAYIFGKECDMEEIDVFQKRILEEGIRKEEEIVLDVPGYDFSDPYEYDADDYIENQNIFNEEENITEISEILKKEKSFSFKKLAGALAVVVLSFMVAGAFFIGKGLDVKKQVLGISDDAIDNVSLAIDSMKESNFSLSSDKFDQAYGNFSSMSSSLEDLGVAVITVSRFVPGASQLSSGYELTQAGKYLSSAGKKISQVAKNFEDLKKNPDDFGGDREVSLLNIFRSFESDLLLIEGDLSNAQKSLDRVKIKDIPEDRRDSILELKTKLPIIVKSVNEFSENSHIIADLLGANGPRKYLFLFQNNQEMRATGGFIGSYGLLDIEGNGRIRNFFVDGIFNPDGQLKEKIVPPKPIQKISATWSLHDSNWFPDFPVSARKAISFYEKTGGPTVDGVITLTPTVMQKLLEVTGPIYMEDYDVELKSENFIENIQYEVEEDYDKEENRPKKILSDLAPIVLDKLLSSSDPEVIIKTVTIMENALKEKHILLYSSNEELQNIISNIGWSGEISKSSHDYIAVINSNINGYKTDGVIDEKIDQQTEIGNDGVVINTVTITRRHNGGNEEYDWWNKVNADYMRVYVPEGSELLEVEGQTRELNEEPLDYDALEFKRDADVEEEEGGMVMDNATGTRIYEDSGKTVFANWVYVSPQEEVSIKYRYKLPFKISLNDSESMTDSFSLLAQKQSGSIGSDFNYTIKYPNEWNIRWKTEDIENGEGEIKMDFKLEKDKFFGLVFGDE